MVAKWCFVVVEEFVGQFGKKLWNDINDAFTVY